MRVLVWFLACSMFLAGCSDPPAAEPDGPFQPIQTGPDVGAISGVVVDAAIVPIAGATITLQDGQTAQTDAEGTFVLEDLEPGTYFLGIAAPRFLTAQTSVDVVAGEVSTPRIQLQADTSPEPYHATQQFSGHMVFYGTIASFAAHLVLQEAGMSICDCEWTIDLDEVPDEVIIEGHWEDSVPDPQGPQQYYLEVFDPAIDDCLWSADVPSGFRVNLTTECTWSQETYRIAMTGPQFWVALEQPYDLFVTPFYRAPAPDGWSVAAGDA